MRAALIALGSLALGACAMNVPTRDAPRSVSLEGENYLISQLTASTWTATTATAKPLPAGADSRANLLGAIEKTSGCKVTDSDYSRQGLQLDAQVDCGNRLKN